MSNINALNEYNPQIPINTMLFLGSIPDSNTFNKTVPMIKTLLTFGSGNNTIIAIPLNSNVNFDALKKPYLR